MKILTSAELRADPTRSDEVAAALGAGGLACFPVRGAYRLAADLRSEAAVLRLMKTKRRVGNHPALVFVPDLRGAAGVVEGTGWGPVRRLAERVWPRALTLVLPPAEGLPPRIRRILTRSTGGIGVRVPEDPLVTRILRAHGGPVLLSSANLAKKPGAQSAATVRQRFVAEVDVWVDAGDIQPVAPSTVVELDEDAWKLVREGEVTRAEIEAALA